MWLLGYAYSTQEHRAENTLPYNFTHTRRRSNSSLMRANFYRDSKLAKDKASQPTHKLFNSRVATLKMRAHTHMP